MYIIILRKIKYTLYIIIQEVYMMDKFVINTQNDKINSINRTIRMKPEVFDKLMELSEHTGVSFNKVVNQCIEYALHHLDESK